MLLCCIQQIPICDHTVLTFHPSLAFKTAEEEVSSLTERPPIGPQMFPFSNFSVQTCKRILQKFEPNFLAWDLWAASLRPGNRLWWAHQSSRLAEDVALRLISSSHSSVNNCCAVGNNAVYVDHRRSGSDRRVVPLSKVPLGYQTEPPLYPLHSVGSLQVIMHSISMEQRAN